MSDCLLLNADYRPLSLYPLSTINWKDAIRLIYLDRVHVVETYENWKVRSQHEEMDVPAVVVSKVYVPKRSAKVNFSRDAVFKRDLHTCQYCKKVLPPKLLTLDHVIPQSQGGGTSWTNIVTCCAPCNSKKADRRDMKPIKQPETPNHYDIVKMLSNASATESNNYFRHKSWRKFGELS